MKLSVIIPIYNRSELFTYGLASLAAQDFKEWELVLVDDRSTEDLSKVYELFPGLQVKHIKIDPREHPHYKGYHTPAYAINVGVRHAEGEVICITQPEMIHSPKSLQQGWGNAMQDVNVFAKVVLSHPKFPMWLRENHQKPFNTLWQEAVKKGQVFQDNELYWYIAFVKKKYHEDINGVNELYMEGVYGEDDEWKERLRSHGVLPELNRNIRGIHIDHSFEGDLYTKQDRTAGFWAKGARVNRERFTKFLDGKREAVIDQLNWGHNEFITDIRTTKT
jgi:glycosyltransferase involved in cell wall biosynthesis